MRTILTTLSLLLLPLLNSSVFAADCEIVARLLSVQGEAQVSDGESWRDVTTDAGLCAGQTLRIGANSRAVVRMLKEQTNMQLAAFSAIRFAPPENEEWSVVEVLKGIVHFISRVPEGLKVRTPYVNAAVEGTEFVVEVQDGKSRISVVEGQVKVQNEAGSEQINGGQSAVAEAGKAPVTRQLAAGESDNLVRWALHYPPVMYPAADAFTGNTGKAVAAQRAGRLDEALALLEAEKGEGDAFYAYRASLLMSRGQVDAAHQDIKAALAANPRSGDALALQAMIELVNNRADAARAGITEALAADPRAATVHLAESYVSQREFRLRDALSSSRLAVQLAPENPLALLRAAELHLMLEQVREAMPLLDKAAELAPQLAQVHTLRGYAVMLGNNYDDAGEAFGRALALNDAEPLAYLGRGLVLMRNGEVVKGREALETATSLDPRNALVRSYVAKAYYEEGRYPEATKQLDLAKDIDRNDPTPWLYDAIVKLAADTPLAALDSLQESIKRNDNRAIYRSRFLLDQDRAVRSADLAQVYRATGNERGAELQALSALAEAPDNYSSHRLLADIYRDKPRHSFAAASEYYQSQLMEPMLMRPALPQRSETALGVISDFLPGQLSWNDYGGMYAGNGLRGGFDLLTGGNNTRGKTAYVYGLGDHMAFSAGIMDFDTDGFRENNDTAIDLGNALVKAQYGIVTMQLEARRKRVVKGDPILNFGDSYSADLRQENIIDTVDLGVRHAFRNGDNMLLSYRDIAYDYNGVAVPGLITFDSQSEGTLGELRYDHHGDDYHALAGVRYREDNLRTDDVIFVPQQTREEVRDQALYMYYYPTWRSLDFTLGINSAVYDDSRSSEKKTTWNPKLGLTWAPSPQWQFRTAAVAVQQRSHFSSDAPDPTIEPVSVQGFVQETPLPNATELDFKGMALDWRPLNGVSAGLELVRRDVDMPLYFLVGGVYVQDQWRWQENQAALNLWWHPGTRWALSGSLQWEFMDADPGDYVDLGRFDRLVTRKVPLELTWFPTSGVTLLTRATAVHQQGRFTAGPSSVEGQDSFWLLDLKAAWALPGRAGHVAITVNNLLDESFSYQETDAGNPTMAPSRQATLQIQINL